MIKYENHCCDCATEAYPCMGSECSLRDVKIRYCDRCREEVDTLYIIGNDELCAECALERLDKI